jgi:hypothetical protein
MNGSLCRPYKSALVVTLALILACGGLIFTCGGGIHAFTLFNVSAPSWNLLLFALLEVVVVGWAYGAERALRDLDDMGVKPGRFAKLYWKVCWRYVTPAVLVGLLVTSAADSARGLSAGDYIYPPWVQAAGVAITASTALWLPTMAIVGVWTRGDAQELRSLLRPTKSWKRQLDGGGLTSTVASAGDYHSCQQHMN